MIRDNISSMSVPATVDYRYDFSVRGQVIRVFASDLFSASRLCIDRWQSIVDSQTPREQVRPYILLVATTDPSIVVAPKNSNVIPFPIKPRC